MLIRIVCDGDTITKLFTPEECGLIEAIITVRGEIQLLFTVEGRLIAFTYKMSGDHSIDIPGSTRGITFVVESDEHHP